MNRKNHQSKLPFYLLLMGGLLFPTNGQTRKTQPKTDTDNHITTIPVRTDVVNKAFYKDLFIDSGIRINSFDDMPAVTYLNLSFEWMRLGKDTIPNQRLQRDILAGGWDDTNGRLLYPDGEPRFRAIYVNGGLSIEHGETLELAGREAYRTFFQNGGSYTGSCAGAYLATAGFDRYYEGPSYLGLWPGFCKEAAITKIFPNYILPKDSPLLRYYNFGGDNKVDSVKHWNGPYFEGCESIPGTEILARNDWPAYKFHGTPSIIAYKPSAFTGRMVPCGGHPEQIRDGERRDLMCAILQYALDGNGCAKVKGQLHNGEVRMMTKPTTAGAPAFTKIGDKQCHHFVIDLPKKARNIRIRLKVLENYNLSLRMAKDTYAFAEDAQYRIENKDLEKELYFPELEAGIWYIGVQCEDTVTSVQEKDGYAVYTNTAVLNGVPYSISASWTTTEIGHAILQKGADVNERIKLLANATTRYTTLDTVITKIVFQPGSKQTGKIRLDAPESEEPIFASCHDSIVTITTPAKCFKAGKATSGLFRGFASLREIENISTLDMSDAISTMYFFLDCRSLEKLDISGLDLRKVYGMNGMFQHMHSLRDLNIGTTCTTDSLTQKPFYFFTGSKDADSLRTGGRSGELTIRCTKEGADWLSNTTLKWIKNGHDKKKPINVKLIDYHTGEEFPFK